MRKTKKQKTNQALIFNGEKCPYCNCNQIIKMLKPQIKYEIDCVICINCFKRFYLDNNTHMILDFEEITTQKQQ